MFSSLFSDVFLLFYCFLLFFLVFQSFSCPSVRPSRVVRRVLGFDQGFDQGPGNGKNRVQYYSDGKIYYTVLFLKKKLNFFYPLRELLG